MTRLSAQTNSPRPVKLLYMGASGSGKTGSLVSLIEAGYDLRVIDLDKGIDPLVEFTLHQCPDKIDRIDVEQVSDVLKGGSTGIEIKKATGFINTMKLLSTWSDESDPAEWGLNTILVIDSLTRLSDYAFNYEKKLNPGVREPRQWYNHAQQRLRQFFDMITSDAFSTNVILCAHVKEQDTQDGMKQFPNTIGKALSPDIPTYFNNIICARRKGGTKRVISTVPTAMLDLKNQKPFAFEGELPLETGMATIFETLRGKA